MTYSTLAECCRTGMQARCGPDFLSFKEKIQEVSKLLNVGSKKKKKGPTFFWPKKTHLWAKSGLQATVLLTVDEISKYPAVKVSLATCIWKPKA